MQHCYQQKWKGEYEKKGGKTIHQNVTGSYFFFAHPKPPKYHNMSHSEHLISNDSIVFYSAINLWFYYYDDIRWCCVVEKKYI